MVIADRTLSVKVIAALRYWTDVVRGDQKDHPDPVDLTVLLPFFNGVLQELLWWNRDWMVREVEPGLPLEIDTGHQGGSAPFTEVSVPGTVGSCGGESLPFVAKVGFAGDRLIRFQAKIGDVVRSGCRRSSRPAGRG